MRRITAIFCDIGGVILTNGWDLAARREAAVKFSLDPEDFEERHDLANPSFEVGRATLNQYLERTVFYCKRTFSPDDFKKFMYSKSSELPEARALVDMVTASGRYLLATINNEGAEINDYRIERFDLRRTFTSFFSSCYVGMRKPSAPIFELALKVIQRAPEECIFVDDRAINVESAQKVGMDAIVYKDASQLAQELGSRGIEVGQK
ncbi:MAG TPA: HAD family phosphatase [Candidatus Acidoferrum sp.]|nr:HAD family phosphatase [Candidatus Acidoferrum sp.]